MKAVWALAAAGVSAWAGQAYALTIVPTFDNSGAKAWTDTEKGVISQAISDWSSRITDNRTINVTLDFTHAGTTNTYVGEWQGGYTFFPGDSIYPWSSNATQTIHFNVDLMTGSNYLWFDPTPTTSNDLPFAAWDGLSVARHEIGHMLGFSTMYVLHAGQGNQTSLWDSHITTVGGNAIFDAATLNVKMTSPTDTAHVYYDYDNFSWNNLPDLMATNLYNNVRAPISEMDLNMLHSAYGYTLAAVPEPGIVFLAVGASTMLMIRRRQRRNA
jgi:hypothetical protein